MGHVDSELTQRFAQSCTTAAFGYARAASAAYAALANQTLDFWTSAARGAVKSRFGGGDYSPSAPYLVTGPKPYRSAITAEAGDSFDGFVRASHAWAASPMFAPMRAWWGMFPLEGNPASWPMAYAMMTAGVPRAVALPAAEANMAAMDAAEVATTSMDRVFSSYRSESGFAMAQIISPKNLFSVMLLAPMTMTMALNLPWAA
jgi:hypothetical protein